MPTPSKQSHEQQLTSASNVMSTAMEGGSGYWCQVDEYHWTDHPRFKVEPLTLREFDDDTGEYSTEAHVVDEEKMLATLQRIADGEFDIQNHYRVCAVDLLVNGRDADYDADDADVFLQFVVFGKLVYG